MPEPSTAVEAVLHQVRALASQARALGDLGNVLADHLDFAVAFTQCGAAKHEGQPSELTELAQTPDCGEEVNADEDVVDLTPTQDVDEFLADALDDITQDMMMSATPEEMVLLVTRTDGFVLSCADALAAVALVSDSITSVVGPLAVGEATQNEDDAAIVEVVLRRLSSDTNLALLGAGRDGFNAVIPLVGVGEVSITSRVGQPADAQLAAELGVVAPELPAVREGQHPINGVLATVAELTGHDVQAQATFTVRYSKDDGDELSTEDVATIIAHPVSQGLMRFGASALLAIEPGEAPSVKTAVFALLSAGEIDLATVALEATAYRGTFDFGPEIGLVSANAHAQLVDENVTVY